MNNHPANPVEIFSSLWRNRSLVAALTHRDVVGRYRGSLLGILWSFFNPAFMLCVYTFVFSVVFKSRWGSGSDSKTEFALVLFAGLIVFNLFAECINRAPGLITSNINYVKKVVFPLEVLPWVALAGGLFHLLVSLGVWLLAYLLLFGIPHAHIFLFPLILLPLILMLMGLSWFLASLGVYLRDVTQFVGIFTTFLMFMSPLFYSINSFPEKYRVFLLINPLGSLIEQTRDVLYWGKSLDWSLLVWLYLSAMLVAWLGFAWFQKTRKGFCDVL